MSAVRKPLLAVVTALVLTACADFLSSNDGSIELPPAFQTIPLGFSANSNSFDESGDVGQPFFPESMAAAGFDGGNSGRGPDGFGKGGIRGLLMGGGLGRDFIGVLGYGLGRGRGPFVSFLMSDRCVFDEASGRAVCPTREKHGVSVDVSFAFLDVDGVVQSAYDVHTTNTVNVQTSVAGTKSRHDGQVTSTVAHSSDRTVGGLATGSSERTIDGVAEATETTTGTRDGVAFTATREAADTTDGIVIPLTEGRPTIPSAGTVVRRMRVEITRDGEVTRSRFRREKVTFDGTNVVQVEITQDDVTKNCTLTLPSRKLVCE